MGLNNRGFLVLVCTSTTLFISGCGLTGNLIDWKGDKSLDNYVVEGNERLPEMHKYIGKSREEVEKVFGKPTDILSPSWFQKVQYEEEWYYKYDKGIPMLFPNEHSMSFYFDRGKVIVVEAF